MKLRRKFLCWLAVMIVMLCVVVSVGCGGGGGGSGSGSSDDVTVPDNSQQTPTPSPTPDNPEPAPAPSPNSQDVTNDPDNIANDDISWPNINGTWKVDTASSTHYVTLSRKDGLPDEYREDVSPFSRSEPVTFELSIKKAGTDDLLSDVLIFSGEGVVSSGQEYSAIRLYFLGETNHVDPSKSETYEFVQTISAAHRSSFEYIGDNTYKTPSISDEAYAGSYESITFQDSSTIIYKSYSTYSAVTELNATLKRID